MKRVMVMLMLMAVILCSLSVWCQPKLIDLGLKILATNQSVTKIEKTLNENNMNITGKDYDQYVNCTFSVFAENSDSIPEVTLEYCNNCSRKIAVAKFTISINSEYYNALNEQLDSKGFALVKDDGNELIYRNDNKIQCNIMFSDDGIVILYVLKRTNSVW